jgi:hypothetical protein
MGARLDREETLRLFRCVVGSQRGLSHVALDQARMSLRNDRQFEQFERSLRGQERRVREELLGNLKNLGIADPSVGSDDLRHMR